MISAYSIAFSSDGLRLYAGFSRYLMVFDVSRPGSDSVRRPKLGKKATQGGIISCIGVTKDPGRTLYATGSYNGTVCVYSEPGNLIARLNAHNTGVTQVKFIQGIGSPWYISAGGRMDSRIFFWDARNLKIPITIVHRRIENHQRLQYDFDPFDQYLFTGSQTGVVCAYDLPQSINDFQDHKLSKPTMTWRAHSDCTNGLSVHPSLPVIATASGQRRIKYPKLGNENQHEPCDSGNSSTDEDATLTDDEAFLMTESYTVCNVEQEDTHNTCSFRLPQYGNLTHLPRENRLKLWAFPLAKSMEHSEDNL